MPITDLGEPDVGEPRLGASLLRGRPDQVVEVLAREGERFAGGLSMTTSRSSASTTTLLATASRKLHHLPTA